jgi:hypothetical protein
MAYCCEGEEGDENDVASQARVVTVQLELGELALVRLVVGHVGGTVGMPLGSLFSSGYQ